MQIHNQKHAKSQAIGKQTESIAKQTLVSKEGPSENNSLESLLM